MTRKIFNYYPFYFSILVDKMKINDDKRDYNTLEAINKAHSCTFTNKTLT